MLIPFDGLFKRHNLNCNGVLHIGANVGEERNMYAHGLNLKRQVWIEANPAIFKQLVDNLGIDFSAGYNWQALNYAIGAEDGEVVLNISNNGSQSSSILPLGTHLQEHPEVMYVGRIEVPLRSIASLVASKELNLEGIDFLNIDIQGYELFALKGMGDLLKQFKAIYLEVNKAQVYQGCAQVEDIDYYLGVYGFNRVETKFAPNKNWGDALYLVGK